VSTYTKDQETPERGAAAERGKRERAVLLELRSISGTFRRLTRKLHIDDIPQIVNILKGEMSFIGPRPERPEFVQHLKASIPFYRLCLRTRG